MKPKTFKVRNSTGPELLIEMTPETYIINGKKVAPRNANKLNALAFKRSPIKLSRKIEKRTYETSVTGVDEIIVYVQNNYTYTFGD